MPARVGEITGNPSTQRRRRRKPPVRVSVPYAPTPTGKAAEGSHAATSRSPTPRRRTLARPQNTAPRPARLRPSIPSSPTFARPPTPAEAVSQARLSGAVPPRRSRSPPSRRSTASMPGTPAHIGEHENLKEPEDLTNAVLLLSGAGDAAKLLSGAWKLGAREIAGAAAKEEPRAPSLAPSSMPSRSSARAPAASGEPKRRPRARPRTCCARPSPTP